MMCHEIATHEASTVLLFSSIFAVLGFDRRRLDCLVSSSFSIASLVQLGHVILATPVSSSTSTIPPKRLFDSGVYFGYNLGSAQPHQSPPTALTFGASASSSH